jgi:hypothetical protein
MRSRETYVLEVKGVEQVGHVLSSPVVQLRSDDVLVSSSGEIFLCTPELVAREFDLTALPTKEHDYRGMIGALGENGTAASEWGDDVQRDTRSLLKY